LLLFNQNENRPNLHYIFSKVKSISTGAEYVTQILYWRKILLIADYFFFMGNEVLVNNKTFLWFSFIFLIKFYKFTEIPRYNTIWLSYLSQFYIQIKETNNMLSVTRISRGIKQIWGVKFFELSRLDCTHICIIYILYINIKLFG